MDSQTIDNNPRDTGNLAAENTPKEVAQRPLSPLIRPEIPITVAEQHSDCDQTTLIKNLVAEALSENTDLARLGEINRLSGPVGNGTAGCFIKQATGVPRIGSLHETDAASDGAR